jgi:phenylacetate-CoA ligase
MLPARSTQILQAWQSFLTTPLETKLQQHLQVDPEAAILAHFHQVAATVPAYQTFLRTQGIDPSAIQSWSDFQQLPLTTKENYLRQQPLAQLCREGQLEQCDMIAVSSGSTGQPSFWARSLPDELQIATRFEQIFHDSFQADRRRTLAVICFALGTWVGGMFTASCCRHLASKGYPITTITPGNNPTEIFRVLQALAPEFEQVVLLGYPPFLKDVIDRGLAQGIDWPAYNVKLVMAGEVFSEEWRSLVGQRLGSTDWCNDSASLYGTADAGVLGNETPLSITIRRWLAEHPKAARSLFSESRLPTLVQYDLLSRYFEVQAGTLLFSGDNGIPLVRYHISDQGGVIPYETMQQFLAQWGFDPLSMLEDNRGVHNLPFVYIFGRSHFTVSYFGANIYPENVTVGLEQSPVCDWVTGKFVLQVQQDTDSNAVLSIAVELAPSIEPDETKSQQIATAIRTQLQRLNSEFANYVPIDYQTPCITLHRTDDPAYFPIGIKHRYTRDSA